MPAQSCLACHFYSRVEAEDEMGWDPGKQGSMRPARETGRREGSFSGNSGEAVHGSYE